MADQDDQQPEPSVPEPTEQEPAEPAEWSAGGDADAQRERAIRIAQIGLVVVALVVVASVLIAKAGKDDKSSGDKTEQTSSDGGGGSTDTKADKRANWPRTVGGRPPALGKRGETADTVTVAPNTKPGVYLWNDFDGWHLWVVNGGDLGAVSGTLSSDDKVAKAALAVADTGTVDIKDRVVTFSFGADAPLTGIDFNPGFFAKNLVFTLNGPAGALPSSAVHVGSKAAEAPFPLVLTKATGN